MGANCSHPPPPLVEISGPGRSKILIPPGAAITYDPHAISPRPYRRLPSLSPPRGRSRIRRYSYDRGCYNGGGDREAYYDWGGYDGIRGGEGGYSGKERGYEGIRGGYGGGERGYDEIRGGEGRPPKGGGRHHSGGYGGKRGYGVPPKYTSAPRMGPGGMMTPPPTPLSPRPGATGSGYFAQPPGGIGGGGAAGRRHSIAPGGGVGMSVPMGAYAAQNGSRPTLPQPHNHSQPQFHGGRGHIASPVDAARLNRRSPPAAHATGGSGGHNGDSGGQEWIPGDPFLDACVCGTTCTCRKGHRVVYRHRKDDGNTEGGEIRYLAKDAIGRNCDGTGPGGEALGGGGGSNGGNGGNGGRKERRAGGRGGSGGSDDSDEERQGRRADKERTSQKKRKPTTARFKREEDGADDVEAILEPALGFMDERFNQLEGRLEAMAQEAAMGAMPPGPSHRRMIRRDPRMVRRKESKRAHVDPGLMPPLPGYPPVGGEEMEEEFGGDEDEFEEEMGGGMGMGPSMGPGPIGRGGGRNPMPGGPPGAQRLQGSMPGMGGIGGIPGALPGATSGIRGRGGPNPLPGGTPGGYPGMPGGTPSGFPSAPGMNGGGPGRRSGRGTPGMRPDMHPGMNPNMMSGMGPDPTLQPQRQPGRGERKQKKRRGQENGRPPFEGGPPEGYPGIGPMGGMRPGMGGSGGMGGMGGMTPHLMSGGRNGIPTGVSPRIPGINGVNGPPGVPPGHFGAGTEPGGEREGEGDEADWDDIEGDDDLNLDPLWNEGPDASGPNSGHPAGNPRHNHGGPSGGLGGWQRGENGRPDMQGIHMSSNSQPKENRQPHVEDDPEE
ncbi:hypothetical protein GQ43DRAFT_494909 [Delitschia confertaspora ATCC 74209]|uniref:Uncharacterized protein n=1 Tax=Delitschia confertaspora ATCC 74209 TaxID=1513339 RepID=A0A9P4JTU6_9PLEO|nr:hypothetical protein GQ43DRAFT_494909 [Delitschia confertaspora ATCC 74209]